MELAGRDLGGVVGPRRAFFAVEDGDAFALDHGHLLDGVVAVEANARPGRKGRDPHGEVLTLQWLGRQPDACDARTPLHFGLCRELDQSCHSVSSYGMCRPPLTDTVWPVMNPASGDARNSTHTATSSGVW